MIAKLVTLVDKGLIYPLLVRVDDSFKNKGDEYFEIPDPFAEDNFKILEKNVNYESKYHRREHFLTNVSSRFTFAKTIVHNKMFDGDSDTFTFNYAPLMYNFTTKCLDLNVRFLKALNGRYKNLNIFDKNGNVILENVFYITFENKVNHLFKNIEIYERHHDLVDILDIPLYTRTSNLPNRYILPDIQILSWSKIDHIEYLHTSTHPIFDYVKPICEKTGRKLIPYREATYLTSLYDYNKYEEMVAKGLLTKKDLQDSWIYAK